MTDSATTIRPARFPEDAATLRELFRLYAQGLGVDLGFQDFEAELAGLPGKYAPPEGAALLAESAGGMVVGCVAMRPLGKGTCEMKRLFLRPKARGLGLGRVLAQAIVAEARKAGYSRMVLDTLATMTGALSVYRGLGFAETAPYYHNPLAGVVFLALDLAAPSERDRQPPEGVT